MTRVKARLLAALLSGLAAGAALPALAQEAWVQIEARPTLSDATQRARLYAGQLRDVSGFALGGGWYGIVLGPYGETEAQSLRARLLASGAIPSDAFIVDGSRFGTRFWPLGAQAARPAPAPSADAAPAPQPEPQPQPQPQPEPERPDETPAEARASEAALGRAQREQLQVALQWAGVYDAAIDGAFGRGTRAAMGQWQAQQGLPTTGILTTRQRAQLLEAYNAVLEGLGMTRVARRDAGIALPLPTAILDGGTASAPFVRYEPTGEEPVQVLLISQEGNAETLAGLYEIMQTLEILPEEGPRRREAGRFSIEGTGGGRHTVVEASLEAGQIKGFALVWPEGDEARRTRVLGQMRAGFERLPGVLDPAVMPEDEAQATDLVSGLQIRQPLREASGIFADAAGTVLTAEAVVAGCGDIAIEGTRGASVLHSDAGTGLAVLRPAAPLAPMATARFRSAPPRLGDEIAVAGYPYGGALPAAAVTFGTLADSRGLEGEATLSRLEIAARPGDVGGPVLDREGAVIGLLLPSQRAGDTALPDGIGLARDAGPLIAALEAAGVSPARAEAAEQSPERLARAAAGMTALVSCWE
ncbi:serine protease [Pseudoroseicyclus aestuarii]|uniref:Putative peptidoglycan binding protein n=1 Tax=Pseudoroseicyclus aestuarii TaxID=1795041 RepID=A0A318SWN5_9RHOB|nr:serine protease [Pseudoroseicyclus aestuarii]PYE85735.1 putative peptidoglycan binding protein [Pseudoroseicyclus aestuarii]